MSKPKGAQGPPEDTVAAAVAAAAVAAKKAEDYMPFTSVTPEGFVWREILLPLGFTGHRKLVDAIGITNRIAKRGEWNLYPKGLRPEYAYTHLVLHRDTVTSHIASGGEQKKSVASKKKNKKQARALIKGMEAIVHGSWGRGTPERVDFYPTGPGEKTEAQRITYLMQGYRKHGLPCLPLGWTPEQIDALGILVEDTEKQRVDAGDKKKVLSTSGTNLAMETYSIGSRLTSIIYGVYGRTNPVVAEFGLKVGSAKPKRSKPKKDPKAQQTQGQGQGSGTQPVKKALTRAEVKAEKKAEKKKAAQEAKLQAEAAQAEADANVHGKATPASEKPRTATAAAQSSAGNANQPDDEAQAESGAAKPSKKTDAGTGTPTNGQPAGT